MWHLSIDGRERRRREPCQTDSNRQVSPQHDAAGYIEGQPTAHIVVGLEPSVLGVHAERGGIVKIIRGDLIQSVHRNEHALRDDRLRIDACADYQHEEKGRSRQTAS